MIDFELARATMVESQLRTDRVTDRRILSAFATLPRERFVPEDKRELAYSDASLEVWPSIDGAPARFLLPPVVLARLVQLAAVEAKDAVLDVGCATGYSTAVLAHLASSSPRSRLSLSSPLPPGKPCRSLALPTRRSWKALSHAARRKPGPSM